MASTILRSDTAEHSGRGLPIGPTVFSMLSLASEGTSPFGTGRSEANRASLAMNTKLGFILEPEWLTLSEPGITGTHKTGVCWHHRHAPVRCLFLALDGAAG